MGERITPVFALEELAFSYPGRICPAVDGVSLSVERGQFITLCGPSGCGKSTLLRQLKPLLSPGGIRSGKILFGGHPLDELSQREQAARIGFVQQSPENQIVTDKVWHELAFGLESLGFDTPTIRGRVAEMASFFGIQTWFYKDVAELSGGQKQLLNLAAVMAMQPDVLILDEPTSQLDPIAAADFLATVGRINRELGTTVIMTEHRLEEVFPLSDRVLVMNRGKIMEDGTPRAVGRVLKDADSAMFLAMPTPMRIYAAVPSALECPVTVRDGRDWLEEYAREHIVSAGAMSPEAPETAGQEAVLTLEDVWFKYGRELNDVVRGLSLQVRRGEFLAILGGNGTGKSTSLSLMAGLRKPYRGKVSVKGSVGLLPQNPQTIFVKKTVEEDLRELLRERGLTPKEQKERVNRVVRLCRLEELLDRHPYDISGGEQQRAALAKVLLLEPEILLLDEPTKGLDAEFKASFAGILRALKGQGVTVVMVSHDVEFCAEYAQRCALFFDGNLVTDGTPRDFFSGNSFYTTSANRMARTLLPRAITAGDVIAACGGKAAEVPLTMEALSPPIVSREETGPSPEGEAEKDPPLPLWRKIIACGAAAAILLGVLHAINILRLPFLSGPRYRVYAFLLAGLFALAAAVWRREESPPPAGRVFREKGRLPRRTAAAAAAILLLIPATILAGVFWLGDREYYAVSLLVLLECMLPFFFLFEGRRPGARELVVLAVLCALGVAGRTAFSALPQFKPVMAIVIVSAVAFGAETGFLVGAVTMLVSNLLFSQGPWTPWQMFCTGLVGFFAGVLFQKGILRRTRLSLAVYGGVSVLLLYGGIMNPASALMTQHTINWKMITAYYLSGLPMDLIYAGSTAFFLWFLSRPMLEKLDRVKAKYGLSGESDRESCLCTCRGGIPSVFPQ